MWSFLWNHKAAVCKIGGYLILSLAFTGVSFYAMYLGGVVKDKDTQITVLQTQNQAYAKSIEVFKQVQQSEKIKISEVNAQLDKCYLALQQQLQDQTEIEDILTTFTSQPSKPGEDQSADIKSSESEVTSNENTCIECTNFINRQFSAIN